MRFFYLMVLLLAGISVLLVEVLGTRLIAPFFGSSLYVWSSLILVTMIALALGNWLGGALADLKPYPGVLSPIFFLAGIIIMLLPLGAETLLSLLFGGPLVPMVLLCALIIFTPPLFLLGMLCPIVVKLLARSQQTLGLTVGSIYALNTVGSVIGVLLAGFFLIPLLGVKKLFLLTALPLLLMAAVGWLRDKQKIPAVLSLLALILLPWLLLGQIEGKKFPPPNSKNRFTVLKSVDSAYGNLKVVALQSFLGKQLCLLMDGTMCTAVLSGKQFKPGESLALMNNHLELLPYFYPKGKTALLIGLGGGFQVNVLSAYGWEIEGVEIDPQVVEIAREYFNYQGNCHIQDGRYFLEKNRKSYDFIIMDILPGDSLSSSLFSRQMFSLCKARLNPSGILALNALDNPQNFAVTRVIAGTLKTVFPQVQVYHSPLKAAPQIVTFFAGREKLDDKKGESLKKKWGLSPQIFLDCAGRKLEFPALPPQQRIITDDYNPLNKEWVYLAYERRKETRKIFPFSVLNL